MKTTFAALALATIMTATVPCAQAADMPAELLGRYVSQKSNCAEMQKSHKQTGMWDGVTITKDRVWFIESSCDVARVSKAGEGAYALVLKCAGEGEEWDVNTTYKLAGNALTISTKEGSERFKRCGK